MTANFLWGSVGSVINLMTTDLNSGTKATVILGSVTGSSGLVQNSGNYQMCRLVLKLASAAFVIGDYVQVFFVPTLDTTSSTTNFPTVGTAAQWWGGASSNYLAGTIYINGTTAAQNEVLDYVTLPVGYFKTAVYLGTGVNLGASGNTLDAYPEPTQY